MKHKLQIQLNEAQMEQLGKESERLGSSMGSIVRMAIGRYFNSEGYK